MVSSLENDPQRLKLIAKYALEDRAAGHMVLIPLTQVKPIRKLIAEINKQAGRRVAFPFYGALKKEIRDKTIEYARNYKIKIIVGNTKLLSTGINIPRASCLYDVAMSSNLENCEQRVSRILTPWDDKPQPLLRIFLDEMNVRKRCLSNEWWRCVVPKFKPEMTPKEKIALEGYLKAANTRNDDPMDL
jgi:superfamily II DNA or RNA helicase